MITLKSLLHFISDFGNAALLIYALLVERDYSIPFLILVILVVGIKVIADLLD